jgi:hypothetical protein
MYGKLRQYSEVMKYKTDLRFPATVDFFTSPKRSDMLLALAGILCIDSSPNVKLMAQEAGCSTASSRKIKNAWS